MEYRKISSFTDLVVWQEGHKLVVSVYELTLDFPRSEVFGLVSQMRRCVVSITSNIAEGFSRSTYKDKLQFYAIAHGSITELQNQFLIARDVGYLSKKQFGDLAKQSMVVKRLLGGLMKKSRSFVAN